ncbi:hypothetical protein FHS85_003496 [Rhodoligotrophos appendicifer]|uniref:hypothetical protein n=1 Tax=Rhodoligotrophos appendicifer TaxID=987056 RepID=UPI001960457B|nr:hypothetical protein [Rhodoligotrophos appendicifer]
MVNLVDFGSFYVGGRPLVVSGRQKQRISYSSGFKDVEYDPNGQFWAEQAYVQYFIPAERRFETPLLLVHGGGLTGACWETTPDGRPGWLTSSLRQALQLMSSTTPSGAVLAFVRIRVSGRVNQSSAAMKRPGFSIGLAGPRILPPSVLSSVRDFPSTG